MSKNKVDLISAICQDCGGTGIDEDDHLNECETCEGDGFILTVQNTQ